MINPLLRGTRKPSRTFTPPLVSRRRATAGDPLEPLGVLHSTERVVMVTVVLLMMMRLKITELSQGRGRALIEVQMMTVVMMRRRLRRMRHFQFSTHLREDSQ
jgi:hypothetical protein